LSIEGSFSLKALISNATFPKGVIPEDKPAKLGSFRISNAIIPMR
jgi:hypothetical protein